MSSNQGSNLEQNCKNMLKDLRAHKRSKITLLQGYITKRLNASIKAYYDSITQSYKSLIYKDSLKMAKRLNKL